MSSVSESTIAEKGKWPKAVMVVVRLVLLVFLAWVLLSTKFPANTPVAEDSPAPNQNSHSTADPCSARQHQFS